MALRRSMDKTDKTDETIPEYGRWAERRKRQGVVDFPLVLPNGTRVPYDRRATGERRHGRSGTDLLLFRDIHDERLTRVLAGCAVRSYAANEVLLAPGQPNHDIYLVLSGRLRVSIGADSLAQSVIIERGECVGELSIIDGKPVSASVVAHTAARVLVIPDVVFWSQIIALPGIARNLLTILSERMRQDNEVIVQNVSRRLQLEHIEKDLQTARTIQASMLPHGYPLFPGHEEFDVYALMDPAKEVSGDFFDVFLVGEDKLFFAIGDVSGKGIPAALFMVRSMTLLRMEASRDVPPHEVLTRVNQQLCRNNEVNMFVTVFCGTIDLARGKLSYSSAGHDAPLVSLGGETFDLLECIGGLMLGIADDAHYESGHVQLKPDAIVLCYTDGVTEAMDRHQRPLGHDRMRKCVVGMESAAEAAHVVRMLHAEIRAFTQGAVQSDDISVLALKYRAPKKSAPRPADSRADTDGT